MPIWCEDKEPSKYSKYKVKVDLTKIGQVASVLAGVLLGGTALARVRSRVSVLALCAFSDSASRELSWS